MSHLTRTDKYASLNVVDGTSPSLTAVPYARVHSIDQYLSRAFSTPEDFLSMLPLTRKECRQAVPLVFSLGPYRAFLHLFARHLFGSEEADVTVGDNIPSIIKQIANVSLDKTVGPASLGLPKDKDILKSKDGSGARLILFPANFKSFPCSKNTLGALGAYADARVFGMFLPQTDADIIETAMGKARNEHVDGAFAYIRFYEVQNNFVVAEIQSDVYGELMPRHLREKYKHWSRNLLLAFESMVALHDACRNSGLRSFSKDSEPGQHRSTIIISNESYQRERWPSIADKLVSHLYTDTPRILGYKPVELDMPLERGPTKTQLVLAQGWARVVGKPTLEQSSFDSIRERFFELYKIGTESLLQRWINAREELFTEINDLEVTLEGIPLMSPLRPRFSEIESLCGTELDRFFEIVPITHCRLDGMPGMRKEFLDTHEMLLAHPRVALLKDALHQDFSWVRKVLPTLEDELASHKNGEKIAIQLPEGRFSCVAYVRFFNAQSKNRGKNAATLEIKGSGEALRYELADAKPGQTFPFADKFMITSGASLDDITLLGGVKLPEARIQFLHTLALNCAYQSVFPEDESPLAIPVDVGVLTHLPVWEDGAARWLNYSNYRREYLGLAVGWNERLSISRSVLKTDCTIVSLLERFFSASVENPLSREFIVDKIALLYSVNGKDLLRPDDQDLTELSCTNLNEVLRFLKKISDLNRDVALELFDTITHRLMRLAGIAHGSGGHLGGVRVLSRVGAGMGSKLGVYFVTLAGEVTDLTEEVYLPWVHSESRTPKFDELQSKNRQMISMYDMLFVSNTIYWLGYLFFGEDTTEERALTSDESFANIGLFSLGDWMLERKDSDAANGNTLQVPIETDLLDIYNDALLKGQVIAEKFGVGSHA